MSRSRTILRGLYGALAGVGLIGVSIISWGQYSGTSTCPGFGPVPACYVILISYASVVISAFSYNRQRAWFFWPGWFGVFAAAALGSSFELAGRVTCPRSGGGTPTCYFSLLMAVLILLLYLAATRRLADRT